MKWGLTEIFSLPAFISQSYETFFCSFSYWCHLPLFGYGNGFHGGDNRTKGHAFCISTYTIEGNEGIQGSQGRALIDFLSQTTEPLERPVLPHTSHCLGHPSVGPTKSGSAWKGQTVGSFSAPTRRRSRSPTPVNCDIEKKNVEKNLQMGLCFSKLCTLEEKNVFKFAC